MKYDIIDVYKNIDIIYKYKNEFRYKYIYKHKYKC